MSKTRDISTCRYFSSGVAPSLNTRQSPVVAAQFHAPEQGRFSSGPALSA